jgi:CheY-like chemotaxis protein/nitrogen-specific signal transduction histidine kinase
MGALSRRLVVGNGSPRAEQGSARTDRADEVSRLKVEFLASLNHEIRTPLSGILGMSDLLLETSLDSEQLEYVGAVRQCAEGLFALLSSTLEYTSLVSGSVRLDEAEVNLRETLEAAVAEHTPAARAKGLDLRLQLHPSSEILVVGDPQRLRQICSILISNAVKFTSRGTVDLLASYDRQSGGRAVLELGVVDSGIGMSFEQQERIFESFSQLEAGFARRFAGLGLGLALARELVDLMGGSLELESEPGQGTAFTARIPFRLAAESAPPAASPVVRGGVRGRILVVEDNRIAQQVISHILNKHALPHDCAPDGWAALEAARANLYDLVLMDLQMPGLDGLETTERLRQIPSCTRVPILALTADSSDEVRHLCRERGLDAFLTKPIQTTDLLEALRQYLPAWAEKPDCPVA